MIEDTPRAGVSSGHGLTPSELVNSVLKTNIFGGYSKTQVDILLERAADVLEALLQENQELRRKGEEADKALEKYREVEESLRAALINAQKMGENMISSAKLQADALLEEARVARARAMFKMEKLPDALRAEISRLTDARDRLRDDLAALLQAHEELLSRIPDAEAAADDYVARESAGSESFPDEEGVSEQAHEENFLTPPRGQAGQDGYEQGNEYGYVNL